MNHAPAYCRLAPAIAATVLISGPTTWAQSDLLELNPNIPDSVPPLLESLPSEPPDPSDESFPTPADTLDPLPESAPDPEDLFRLEEGDLPDTPLENAPEVPPVSFFLEDIRVIGNTIFHDEIEELVTPLEGREVAFEDLLTLRTDITRLYIDNDYISSGAFIPTNQVLNDGVVEIQVVEGKIEQIQINGLSRLQESYVRSRLNRSTQEPLNVRRLEEGLQLLQVNPLLQTVDAELTAGSGPGQNVLILDLAEADPFFLELSGDNYRAPSIGSAQGSVAAAYGNVLGFGDRAAVSYDLTEGLDTYEVSYEVPVNGLDGTAQVRYQNADSRIIDPLFEAAGIRSESETLSFSFRQPIIRSLTTELALGLSFDVRESRSFILDDIPFSFSAGPEDGVSKVRALRFSQDWVNRDINTVLAARSQFSFGLDLFDATVNNSGIDGRFFSWLGQFQWLEQFPSNLLLVTRVNAQLTPDSLLPLERFSVGGIDTVRGYVQNQIVTDNAITASSELRLPLVEGLQLTPFVDLGGGWNIDAPEPDPSFLLGLGLGLRWQPTPDFSFRVDYGIPLISGEDGDSLQENGIYLSLTVRPF